ncbi:TolC family protein [Sphingobacterium sp. E70]|nr:TolC family protein [Sphingobacterium sp. E70]
MESEILLDTTAAVSVSNRIEFQQLETSKKIQQLNTQYFKWTYLPSVSAFYNYAFNYRNDKFSKLYNDNFPGSVAGLNLSFSIFDGFKRKNKSINPGCRRNVLTGISRIWKTVSIRSMPYQKPHTMPI